MQRSSALLTPDLSVCTLFKYRYNIYYFLVGIDLNYVRMIFILIKYILYKKLYFILKIEWNKFRLKSVMSCNSFNAIDVVGLFTRM